jgi:hypothetical protein
MFLRGGVSVFAEMEVHMSDLKGHRETRVSRTAVKRESCDKQR